MSEYKTILLLFFFFWYYIRMEPTNQNNDINVTQETRQVFNEFRSNLSIEEINRSRKKLKIKESVYNFLNEKEQNGSLTNKDKKVLKNIDRYLKNISMHPQNFKKYFKKYQYDLDYLFNEYNEEGYISNNAFKDVRKFLNELKSNLLCKETNEIRKNLNKKEADYSLKEKEQKGSLTNKENKKIEIIDRYLESFKNSLDKFQKYRHNITYGLD